MGRPQCPPAAHGLHLPAHEVRQSGQHAASIGPRKGQRMFDSAPGGGKTKEGKISTAAATNTITAKQAFGEGFRVNSSSRYCNSRDIKPVILLQPSPPHTSCSSHASWLTVAEPSVRGAVFRSRGTSLSPLTSRRGGRRGYSTYSRTCTCRPARHRGGGEERRRPQGVLHVQSDMHLQASQAQGGEDTGKHNLNPKSLANSLHSRAWQVQSLASSLPSQPSEAASHPPPARARRSAAPP